MKPGFREIVILVVLSAIALGLWYHWGYSKYEFVDLSVSRNQALQKAEDFLVTRGFNPADYKKAVVFEDDSWADRYLQKTLGFDKEEEFIRAHDYDLFYWHIRFFQEKQKEELRVGISSKSGEIIYYNHLLEDTTARKFVSKQQAELKAKTFLKNTYNIDFDNYTVHEQRERKYDNRLDYLFSWEKNDVYIPRQETADGGGAKLLVEVTIAGEEVRHYSKAKLDVPETFERYVEGEKLYGASISNISFLVSFFWIIIAIALLIQRRNNLVIKKSWRLLIGIGVFLLILTVLRGLNNFQNILLYYPTASSFSSYVSYYVVSLIPALIIGTLSVAIMGVAGESLRYEQYPQKKYTSFFQYIVSSFFNRSTAASIALGYFFFLIMLGLQTAIYRFGESYLGVWDERYRLSELSSALVPFFSAFVIGCKAALSEEITFRIFGISWAKKYLKKSVLAVILISLVWGFGHTGYLIFPIWFRGIEVTILGLFMGFIFLKYGIIAALVTHYLFNVFLGTGEYLLGKSSAYLFFSSLSIMLLPLLIALVAFLLNRSRQEKKPELLLNKNQKYNIEVLLSFISAGKDKGKNAVEVSEELIAHGWDRVLVDIAIKRIYHQGF